MRPMRHREIFRVLQGVRGMSPTEVAKQAKKCGRKISASTVAKLRKPVREGGTRFPQMWTLEAIARVGGMKYDLVPIDEDANTSRDTELETGAATR